VPISLNLLKTSTFRLAAAYLFVFVLSVAAILGYVYWNTAVLLERQIDSSIEAEIATFASEYQQTGLAGLLETLWTSAASWNPTRVYLFTNPLGRRLAGNLNALPVAATGRSGWIDFSYAVETAQGLEHRAARAYYSRLEGGYRVVIGRDVDELAPVRRHHPHSLLWAVAITVVLGLSGGLLTSRNFLRRIDQITGTSQTIMAGDLTGRMPVSGTGDELDRLASNLNAMLDQIERLMAGMQEISTNVAHDLRTPLSRLKARAEDALRSGSKADHRQALEQVLEETDRLLATFNALLAIARAEAGHAGDKAAAGRGRRRRARGRRALRALGGGRRRPPRRQRRRRALDLGRPRASGPGAGQSHRQRSEIWRRRHDGPRHRRLGRQIGPEVAIEVADRGPGIPEPDREHVKERFVRLEPAAASPAAGWASASSPAS
jgi:signal transduction histidine kinase